MNRQIDNIRKTRSYVIDQIKELSLEKINKVPHGFNNNIMWNVGHLVAAQQAICYVKGGLTPSIPEEAYADFKPGTRPDHFFDSDVEDEIKQLILSSLDVLQQDYQENAFKNFIPWTNRYGIALYNIDEAIQYLQFHEGLHVGVILSIRKLVQK